MIQNTVTILICIMTFKASYSQRIISPQPGELQNLCPGEEVNITCEARESSLIAWASDDYIGADGVQLEFILFDSIGTTRTSSMNPNTVATLINKTVEEGVHVLVSQLRIRTMSQFLNSSVTCIDVSSGTWYTITIRVRTIGMFH